MSSSLATVISQSHSTNRSGPPPNPLSTPPPSHLLHTRYFAPPTSHLKLNDVGHVNQINSARGDTGANERVHLALVEILPNKRTVEWDRQIRERRRRGLVGGNEGTGGNSAEERGVSGSRCRLLLAATSCAQTSHTRLQLRPLMTADDR